MRTDPAEWGRLMAAAQRGDAGAYRTLLGQLRPWLTSYYRRRLPPGVVDDAVQDAMIAMHEKRHTYDPGRPFAPWIAGIARYKWIDRLRAMPRAVAAELPPDLADDAPDHGASVVSANVLQALLAQLPPGQAEVIRLTKLLGFSVTEAAERTGQSESLVKVNVHRGLARLAAAAGREMGT
jgi:RNA polymerase sigma-70 factor (ECF subfamily)